MLTYMTESEVLKHFKVENGSTGSTLISEPEAKMPNDDDLCTICLSNKRTYALYCGHFAYCESVCNGFK